MLCPCPRAPHPIRRLGLSFTASKLLPPTHKGQQVQKVTEDDLDFAPGPELDQILKFQRLFCLSIIMVQMGLQSSSQADRSPVTRDKSKLHLCAVPDPREAQCYLQPCGRRDRGGFSSSPWLEKLVAGPNLALADETVNPSQNREPQPRWPKETEKYHQGSCKFPWRKRQSAIEILPGSRRQELVPSALCSLPVPSSCRAKGTFSTFHTFVTANIPISQLDAG